MAILIIKFGPCFSPYSSPWSSPWSSPRSSPESRVQLLQRPQFFHWSAVNELKPLEILYGILPTSDGVTNLSTRDRISPNCGNEIKPLAFQTVIINLAVPSKTLCIGSTTVKRMELKYGSLIKSENRTPYSHFILCRHAKVFAYVSEDRKRDLMAQKLN